MTKQGVLRVCRPTKLFLRIALPLILLVAVYVLISYLIALSTDPIMANSFYPPLAEYIFSSALIALVGAVTIQTIYKK